MRPFGIVVAVLGLSLGCFGQGSGKPAGQSATPAPAAAQTAGQTAAPAGKRPPAAKTIPEFEAYKKVLALTDAAAQEKAADEFVTAYPNSELHALTYKQGPMRSYQAAHNDEKTIQMARKVLSFDADDPEALLTVAQLLADRTKDSDLDKDVKLAEARKDAERALVTVDTDVPSSGYPPEQLAAFKANARSEAYEILGILAFNANKWPDAEANLRKSIDALPEQPDALAVYRLAVSLDMQDRVPEALKYADQAVTLTKDQPDSGVGKAARDEKDRLQKLSSGTAPGSPAPK
jgi:tetratricopeptide (TPR) repeat protein